ncbi:putative transporter (transmembrane protein) [Glutamicibacter mysorens]|uniref:Transporter (Transmembrane protein) n=1 Tax=Glutamicibacter mysorens TaxID=257984 RepID=A0ABX4MYC3_9MICC|nr:mechanosensitive ion channel [Glutamicibacter mysorens]PJJ44356.1 putative transporter (transmembrane protein) [Glutamicibacter mysorens]
MQSENVLGNIDWASMLQKVGIALIILIITWLLARIVRWAAAKLVTRVKFLQKQGNDGEQIGQSLGKVAGLIVWLFGLVAILQVFALSEVLSPVQGLLGGVMAFIPNLIGAGFIFFIGYVIANIVRQLLKTGLGTVDFSGLVRKLTPSDEPVDEVQSRESQAKIVDIIANIVFALFLLVVAISALQVLGIAAISDPAQQMLQLVFTAIPQVIMALVLLAVGILIAKFVGQLLESTLHGVGTDSVVAQWGVVPEGKSASGIIAGIVKIAIVLFFGVMAAQMLNFPAITNILNEILALGGKILFGAAIIAAGFVIANVIGRFLGDTTASKIIRYTAIALFVAMGLKYMGIADSIINMAFGAIVIGAALAAALAFGLGGRDAAARTLKKIEANQATDGRDSTPPASTPGI